MISRPRTPVTLIKVRLGNPPRLIYKASWTGLRSGVRRRLTETIGPVRTTKLKDARLYCAEKADAIRDGMQTPDRLDRIPLSDFLDHDREQVRHDLKATSRRELKSAGAYATRVLGEDFPADKVNSAAVGRIKLHLQEAGLAPPTVTKHLRYLQGAFRRGVDRGWIFTNPFAKQDCGRFQTPAPKSYKPREVEALLDVCRKREDLWWEAFIALGYTSGLRRGEMVHLLWSSIDFEKRTVTLDPQNAGSFEHDGQTYRLLAWSAKDFETRITPVPSATVDVLRRLKAKADASPYAFISLDRLRFVGSHLDANDGELQPNFPVIPNLPRDFGVIRREAARNLGTEWGKATAIKHLRSTYGTTMSNHTTPFRLCKLMGHSSVKTTEKYYIAAQDGLHDDVASAFGEAPQPVKLADAS